MEERQSIINRICKNCLHITTNGNRSGKIYYCKLQPSTKSKAKLKVIHYKDEVCGSYRHKLLAEE